MDQTKVPLVVPEQKSNTSLENFVNRRSVLVKVQRLYPQRRKYRTDINNNQSRYITHPINTIVTPPAPKTMVAQYLSTLDLPKVSLCFAILQVLLYLVRELIGVVKEESVCVSWKTVILECEFWRLLYAQFFHFGRVHIFFNVVTLMGIGRALEKKLQPTAYALLVIWMSVVSNFLYIFLNDILCTGPSTDFTVGFSTTMFSLRMIHIFTMDSEANNGKGDPNLIFGFFPVYLPAFISPWQPVIETIFFDIFIIGRCVAATISGMCAGLVFPYLMRHFRNYIFLPRNPPPPPPKFLPRQTNSQRSSDESDSNNNNNGNSHDHND